MKISYLARRPRVPRPGPQHRGLHRPALAAAAAGQKVLQSLFTGIDYIGKIAI